MKFQIERKHLQEAVNTASKATSAKGVNPMLANILIDVKDKTIDFIGTNDEIMQIISVDAEIEEGGKICVPARLLVEMVSNLPDTGFLPVLVDMNKKGELRFKAGKSKFNVKVLDATDFPPVPDIETEYSSINGSEFGHSLKQVVVSASPEGSPVHRSVCLNFENVQSVCALDGKRLSEKVLTQHELSEDLKQMFLIPSTCVDMINSLFSCSVDAQIGKYKEQLVFKSGNTTLISKLVDGKYPSYKRIFPQSHDTKVTVNKKAMSQAIKSIMPIAKNNSFVVQLEIDEKQSIKISASSDLGEAENVIDCEIEGNSIITSFDANKLNDFLKNIDSEEFTMKMTTSTYPCLFESGIDDCILSYILMPIVFVNN